MDELLWSLGATYDLSTEWQLLGGVHTGFAPTSPSDKDNIAPEESTNYEVGVRFNGKNLSASAIAFFSDYENKVTNCSAAFHYIDEMCHDNTCDRAGVDDTFLSTDRLLVFDLASHYSLSKSTNLYLKVDNLFDAEKIVARSPDGAPPNKPRTAMVGLKFAF